MGTGRKLCEAFLGDHFSLVCLIFTDSFLPLILPWPPSHPPSFPLPLFFSFCLLLSSLPIIGQKKIRIPPLG